MTGCRKGIICFLMYFIITVYGNGTFIMYFDSRSYKIQVFFIDSILQDT